MRLRPYVLRTLVWKDMARLVRNGPALMHLGLMVIVAFLVGSSGLVEQGAAQPAVKKKAPSAMVLYWEDSEWVDYLKSKAPPELGLQFVPFADLGSENYRAGSCVIELRPSFFDKVRKEERRHVRYRYPGTDQNILFPYTRWFLTTSMQYFGEEPQIFETINSMTPPQRGNANRSALKDVSIADVLTLQLVGTSILTMILFLAACGLMVSLTAQERERGALRAILLTPASYIEFVLAKGLVHGTLALVTVGLVMAGLQPAVLTSLLFWGTMVVLTCGYFAVGLLISAFAKNQAAPNLLSFAYLLGIGALNLLGSRFAAFNFLSSLTFERYGLMSTLASLNNPDVSSSVSLQYMRTTNFRMLVLLSAGMLFLAMFVGAKKLRSE